jgi:hypothetical protein
VLVPKLIHAKTVVHSRINRNVVRDESHFQELVQFMEPHTKASFVKGLTRDAHNEKALLERPKRLVLDERQYEQLQISV